MTDNFPLIALFGDLYSLCTARGSWLKRSMSWKRRLSHPTFKWPSRQLYGKRFICSLGRACKSYSSQRRIE